MLNSDSPCTTEPTKAMSWDSRSQDALVFSDSGRGGPACYNGMRGSRNGPSRLPRLFTTRLVCAAISVAVLGAAVTAQPSSALPPSTPSSRAATPQKETPSSAPDSKPPSSRAVAPQKETPSSALSPKPPSSRAATPPDARNPGDPVSETQERIAALEAMLSKAPNVGSQWLQLGAAYLRRAFETGDPALYPLAQRSLQRANQLLGPTPEVLSAQTSLALARHEFVDAQALSTQLLKLRPLSVEGRIARFDAIVELGNYADASTLIEDLVDQRAGLTTLARLSYIKQLLGDSVGAEMAMRAAVGAAPKESFDRAVALGYLGDVLMENGKILAASRSYSEALRIAPSLYSCFENSFIL